MKVTSIYRFIDLFKVKVLSFLKDFENRLMFIIWCSQTTAVRFWFALASIGFSSFILCSESIYSPTSEYKLMTQLAPNWFWAFGFALNGLSLLYGVFMKTYNKFLVILEGLLGTVVWCASAGAVAIAQQAIGAHVVGGLIAFWLLVRYPTHKEYKSV